MSVSRLRAVARAAAAGEGPRFYQVAQVAAMLGVSTMSLYRAINAGEFPAIRIRGRLIVPARALEEMVEAACAGQTVVDAADWVPPAQVAGVALP